MADLAKEAELNANPLHHKAHLAPYAGQKEVLFHFLPFAQTVIDFAEQCSKLPPRKAHVPSVILDFYGEHSRLFEMGNHTPSRAG